MASINHNKKFIFIHIPRTGGSSIMSQLKKDPSSLLYKRHFSLKKMLQIMRNQFDLNCENYFKFGFVRNPWDVFVTKYHAPVYKNINSILGKSFLFFLQNYHPIHSENNHFYEYFLPEEVDFVGRFENREKDLNYISKKINIPIDPKFSIKAKEMQRKLPVKKHYTEYYNDETREIVAERCVKDIEYFGYEFGD